MRCVWHVICVGEMTKAQKTLVGKPQRDSTLGRSSCRWEVNNKMGLRKIRRNGMNCISWIRTFAMAYFCEHSQWTCEAHEVRKLLISWAIMSFSRQNLQHNRHYILMVVKLGLWSSGLWRHSITCTVKMNAMTLLRNAEDHLQDHKAWRHFHTTDILQHWVLIVQLLRYVLI
jgi:hypothetical protein